MSVARLRVRVAPGAARPGIVGRYGSAWKVRVSAPAERGRANDALVDVLSDALDLPRAGIEIVSGLSAREKVVALRGITEAEAATRLDSAAERARDGR